VLAFQLEGELSFGTAPDLERHFTRITHGLTPDTRVVVLFLSRARNPDAVFLDLLDKFHRLLRARDTALLLCGVRDDLARALGNTALNIEIGPSELDESASVVDITAARRRLSQDTPPTFAAAGECLDGSAA
jgi:anti-anti-sigma regulatory factor